MKKPILEIKDLTFSYKKGRTILDHINYTFEKGKLYAVLGGSGSGKSTFLSLLGGIEKSIQNIMTAIAITENVIEDPDALCMKLLQEVGIDRETAERNVKKISGGEQQRIAIARALAKGAGLILADEPTGNLDEDTADEIMKLFLNIAHTNGQCVILVTHSRRLAAMADVCLSIRDHRLIAMDEF